MNNNHKVKIGSLYEFVRFNECFIILGECDIDNYNVYNTIDGITTVCKVDIVYWLDKKHIRCLVE